MSEIKLNTIEEAIEVFREGKFLIVVDDEDRENEGDFTYISYFTKIQVIFQLYQSVHSLSFVPS